MLSPEKIKVICDEYGVGDFISIGKIAEGVLNENYFLQTATGKYFIKSVRGKLKNKLEMIFWIESFMKSQEIPAIVMQKTRSGTISLELGEETITLYPFIENDMDHMYSEKDFYTMGKILGKIHKISEQKILSPMPIKEHNKPSSQTISERLQVYRDEITKKAVQNDADKEFLHYIDFKMSMRAEVKDIVLTNNTLIHGDYHHGNILIDKETREIIGICDWEKTEYAPRSYELARSILYNCFGIESEISKSLDNGRSFMEGYRSIISITPEEIMSGFDMRISRMILSSWIEEKYYRQNDIRANHFIESEIRTIDSYINGNLRKEIEGIL